LKVVLLAGGLGTRMREETEFRPKPMVLVGGKPVLWHIMKIYSYFGHNEFVICAGYKSELIKNYFLNYSAQNNDFTINLKNNVMTFHKNGVEETNDWKVTVVDTGQLTETGGRIKRIQQFIDSESFMCTYGDGLSDINLDQLDKYHATQDGIATLTITRPASRFGVVELNNDYKVTGFLEKPQDNTWINIGFFIFNYKIFDYLGYDSVLEKEILPTLAAESQLSAFKHETFWQPMDTFREAKLLNDMWEKKNAPWAKYL